MSTAYLALGSNLGNRQSYIQQAINALEQKEIRVDKISAIHETDPIGGPKQGEFLNAVIKIQTMLSPQSLLAAILSIENQLGRQRQTRNGPRTIDIDILLYDNLKIKTPDLEIPHPRMYQRSFVMNPLREIDPKLFRQEQGGCS